MSALCEHGEPQTTNDIVDLCPDTRLWLPKADEGIAVDWLNSTATKTLMKYIKKSRRLSASIV